MRVLLFTGKGGAGTTTCAAATAAHLAASGSKTLLLATRFGALADVCQAEIGATPAELAGGLYAAEIDTQRGFAGGWVEVQRALHEVLTPAGADRADDADLAALPGVDLLIALLELHNQAASGRWDTIVVDCGPSGEAVRLLALPAVLSSYLQRLVPLPPKGRAPVPAAESAGDSPPGARLFDAIVRLHGLLGAVGELLSDAATASVRLVLTPQQVAIAQARRAITALALHGYAVDDVLVNGSPSALSAAALAEAFAPRSIRLIERLRSEPLGVDTLRELGATIYRGDDPVAVSLAPPAVQVDRVAAGYVLSLALPFAARDEIDVIRRGDELVVSVQGQRRTLTLPSALRRCAVTKATLADGRLTLDFVPDPAQWLRS